MKTRVKAIQIFYDYERLENRMPTREEFEVAFYGRVMKKHESRYYWTVKKQYLEEREEE